MKERVFAWEVDAVGNPWSLRLTERPLPSSEDGKVVVRVAYSALNFADGLMMEGKYQNRPPLPFVPGHEFAGTIVESADATLPVGTRIAAQIPYGGMASHIQIEPGRCVPVPEGVGLDLSAATLVSYTTAYVAVHDKAALKPGDILLVHAAAGALGSAAAQLAKAAGARVIGVVGSEAKREAAAAAGCDHVLLSSDDWPAQVQDLTQGVGVRAVLDSIGGETTKRSLRLLAWGGSLLVVGFSSGEIASISANRLLLKALSVMGVYWSFEHNARETTALQSRVLELVARRDARPAIDSVWPAAQLEQALAKVMAGESRGKVLLQW